MRALVTGGAGFIGHHLVGALLDAGHDVVILDDFSTGSRERVEERAARARVVQGDIRDPVALAQANDGVEVVFHLAAVASVTRSIADPLHAEDVNVGGTLSVMQAAADARVRRVVFASSCAVYGDAAELPIGEDRLPRPRSPYAVTKLAAESYVHVLGALSGIETISLRYFNVFGPGQDPNGEYAAVVARFITAALAKTQPTIYGDGRQSRDFIHVSNIVSANLAAAEAANVTGLTFNVGSGRDETLLELLVAIESVVDRVVTPRFESGRAGDVRASRADISRAARDLGYVVETDLAAGIADTVASYRATPARMDAADRPSTGG